jgi:O-antigen/teichoic acid export membrane protein
MDTQDSGAIQDLSTEAIKGGGIGLLGTGTGKFILFVLNVFLARLLGTSGYGLYSIGSSLVRIANSVATLGLPSGVVRFGVKYSASQDTQRVKGLFISASLTSLLISVLLAAALTRYAGFLGSRVFNDMNTVPVIKWMVWSIPCFSLMQLSASAAQVFRRIDLNQLIGVILRPAILILLLVILLPVAETAAGAGMLFTVAAGFAAVAGVATVVVLFPEIVTRLRPIFETKVLLRFSAPVLFSGLLFIVLNSLDRLMLGILSESQEVGIFSAAGNVSQVMTLVLTAFIPISMTMIADLHANGRYGELSKLYQSIARWILILTLPAFLVVVIAPSEVMLVFGRAFSSGGAVLLVLSIGQLFNAGTGPVGKLMEMTGKQDINVAVVAAVIVLNAGLNYALIPTYGALGAAVSTTIATVVVFGGLVVLAGRLLGFRLLDGRTLPVLAIAALAAGLAMFARSMLFQHPTTLFVSLLTAAVAVLIYAPAIVFVGVTDYDKQVLRALWGNIGARLANRS